MRFSRRRRRNSVSEAISKVRSIRRFVIASISLSFSIWSRNAIRSAVCELPASELLLCTCSTLILISRRSFSKIPRTSFKPASRISMRCCCRVKSALAFSRTSFSLPDVWACATPVSAAINAKAIATNLFIISASCSWHSVSPGFNTHFRHKLGKKKRSIELLFRNIYYLNSRL